MAEDEPDDVLVSVVNRVFEIVDVPSSLSVNPVDEVIMDVTVDAVLDEAVVVVVIHLLSSQ